MRIELAFRRSLYLSLGLACATLCVAELPFLPEIRLIAVLVGGLLGVAYYLEGRWSLSLGAANTVGMVLTALLGIWIAYQFFRPASESLIHQLPWPTSLLPYLGPVLLVLIPAKLYRPKEIGDYWAMYGLGLMAVSLGCAMAEDGLFGMLLLLWLVSFIWSLTLFYLYRESGKQPELRVESIPIHLARKKHYPLLRRSSRWSFGIAAIGLVLFLVTPRLVSGRWHLTMQSREVGSSKDNTIDLTYSGTLSINQEIAFQVRAENADGTPKTDLPADQLWRTTRVVKYENGKWRDESSGSRIALEPACRPAYPSDRPDIAPVNNRFPDRKSALPKLGPNQYFLTFEGTKSLQDKMPVLHPVQWKARDWPPVVSLITTRPESWMNWRQSFDAGFAPQQNQNQPLVWCQTARVSPERDVSPPLYIANNLIPGVYTQSSMVPNLKAWTDRLVERLVRENRLPLTVLDLEEGKRKREHHELIARALSSHLSQSGEYSYTLDLSRKDRRLDPAEDFLYNVKEGHCSLFATALALMCRTQGIPAHVILGFKGCELQEDGLYVVRQSHAHAWVDILVPRQRQPDDPPYPEPIKDRPMIGPYITFRWVTLDPNPELSNASRDPGWLQSAQNQGTAFFKNFILGYNSDLREKTGQAVMEFFQRAGDAISEGRITGEVLLLLTPIAIPILWLGLRSMSRRIRRAKPSTTLEQLQALAPFHARLLEILAKNGFEPKPSQTAKEFAESVTRNLTTRPHMNGLASVPMEAADLYYRVRFGNEILSPDEQQTLDHRLDQFETTLASVPTTRL